MWQGLHPQQTQGVWTLPLPMVGVGTQKGKQEYPGCHHPPHEEQNLATRSTWVSAHTVRTVLCLWYQAWPPGTPLPLEVLEQDSLWG